MSAQIRVECYAGYKADQRPLRFHLGERQYEIVELLDQWYSPDATFFRVKADDGNLYILRHTSSGIEDTWSLESFRREG